MKIYLLILVLLLAGCSSTQATPTPTYGNGEPIVATSTRDSLAIDIPATVTPQTVVMQPATAPIRVQFASGTYGTTIKGTGTNYYALWAKSGQRYTVAFSHGDGCQVQLHYTGKDGTILAPDGNMMVATLQDTGDHIMGVRCNGDYMVSVGIQ